ncbi:SPOR domain-containing protein [Marinilabilia rubra]|uniref:SPOR domain-containing protein n=2 Tax=Marinilabilia rubra TaxID=2162893 RepID=A0A2U2BAE9_9BACT|nr:SPOR domain-containing protein [Marinilabilia rubra]
MVRNIFLLIGLLVFLSSCASLRKGSSKMSESPYAEGGKDDGIEVREDKKPVAEEEKEEEQEIIIREEKVKSVDIEENEDQIYRYYVIVGSFRYLDNARNYKKDLIDEGFVPVILENENGLYRVSVAAYNDELPARNNIAAIRRNFPKYSDVWLLIRKQ